MVPPNDKYLGKSLIKLGEFAEAQVSLFEQIINKDMIVVDAGANMGAHTVVFAQLAHHVYAFEPQKAMFHILCGNVALNDLGNVDCFRVALGDQNGLIRIPVLDTSLPENNLGALALDMEEGADEVPMAKLTIDCHFLKVDVEGYEAKVLKGAEEMIRRCRPAIYVENDREDKAEALIEQIRSMDYTPYWHITPLYREDNYFQCKEDPLEGCCSIDMLCMHKSVPVDGLQPV